MYNEDQLFSKWAAEMYDRDETGAEDVDFALYLIGLRPRRVLDVACGSGRFLVPLARAGHTAEGFDFDPAMLERIPLRAGDTGGFKVRQADAVRDIWGGGFDVVLLAANLLFNIVSDTMSYPAAQRLLIDKAAAALRPGGHVFIDYDYTLHPERRFADSGPRVIWEGMDSSGQGGRMTLLDSSYDQRTRILRFTRRLELDLPDGRVAVQDIPSYKHFATLALLHTWLGRAGLTLAGEWGDYDRRPIGEDTSRAILWARKG